MGNRARFKTFTAAAVLGAALAILLPLAWYGLKVRTARLETAETARLASELAPDIRSEEPGPESRARFQARAAGLTARSPAASALVRGALAFFDEDPAEADRLFSLAAAACPDDPHLPSFQAAANLRLGNSARALDLYLLALERKTRAKAGALDLAGDEMGVTLALFILGRPAEAREHVEKAWQTRLEALGPDDPETLAAANRLATTYVSLDMPAEELLLETYQRALAAGDRAAGALRESRLLLTVLYNQAGRQAELEDFFDRAALASARTAVPADAGPPTSPAAGQTPPAGRGRPDWEKLARALAGRNEALAVDLWARQLEALDGRPEEQRRIRRELARAALGAGQAERALAELGAFAPADWFDAAERASLGAEALGRLGRWSEAVGGLTKTAESLDAFMESARKSGLAPDQALANLSLGLRLKLAELYLKQGRVPQEAEIELRAALGRLDRKTAARCLLAPEINLRLGRLTHSLGRQDESREFYKRAQAGAEALLAENPGPAARLALTEVARAASEESRAGPPAAAPAAKPAAKPKPGAKPEPPALPEPELLRLEMRALAALGRLAEFPERMRPVLEAAEGRFGPGHREYLLYYSLWLKWLEESGQVEELTRALEAQAADPPGQGEIEKRLNRGGALFYAARVNDQAGRRAEAAAFYQAARSAWLELDRPGGDPRLAGRLAEVDAALSRLAAADENVLGSPD